MRLLVAIIVFLLMSSAAEAKKHYQCRSAITGKIVSAAYAKANPATTTCSKRHKR